MYSVIASVLTVTSGSVKVRLFGSTEDLEATTLFSDKATDIALLKVVIGNNPIQNHPVVTFTTASDKINSLVALVGNYNPQSALKSELEKFTEDANKNSWLFPFQPAAVGGYIA